MMICLSIDQREPSCWKPHPFWNTRRKNSTFPTTMKMVTKQRSQLPKLTESHGIIKAFDLVHRFLPARKEVRHPMSLVGGEQARRRRFRWMSRGQTRNYVRTDDKTVPGPGYGTRYLVRTYLVIRTYLVPTTRTYWPFSRSNTRD